ncbi:hypothetical protein SELMODRAFT_409472 [Selaginella moellendorffii]|uniref:Uncharacterized protein n=1 Tax=Selaginella moellendorffii TaxID=88036 RepID=D8RBJ9_SELML|nr:hypothetical protein SELMODRAFT_409472 [Selaginella moellendorffii]
MEVVLGMHYISRSAGAMKSRQELWDPEAFIRKFLVCGYNFADYAGGRTFQDTLYHGVDEVSGPVPIPSPPGVTFWIRSCCYASIYVVKWFPMWTKSCSAPRLGNVIPDVECEVDALMACGEWAVVCSMQRNASQEIWHGGDGLDGKLEIAWESCVSATGKMNASPKSVVVDGKPHAGAVLMEAKQILYVAFSVIEEEPATSWGDVFFKEKPVTGLKLKLWDLVKDIEESEVISDEF